ncbi:hypothetical protein IL992_09930 [Microbispora sp. NEAU-D428]|uniref:hypothetical protein n=1 Tax=Microbispora sitophila TaxID=2771537 RepID=UPI0018677FFC|nr:hypothetical protein [Microbispora sitophila]MBE3009516.1 hypothetical protein [Microbispora sitophila]
MTMLPLVALTAVLPPSGRPAEARPGRRPYASGGTSLCRCRPAALVLTPLARDGIDPEKEARILAARDARS